eukprot:TRINITY_DN6415_c0_g1_i2.p1 TRINITY_DN6415_c0_g1~~TRINITY_DN6415_c0_g1_i2.p1  ORF type:complete len:201 (-),score=15.75 TRINITY_DN6415_c0_g1_i2:21-623(-)
MFLKVSALLGLMCLGCLTLQSPPPPVWDEAFIAGGVSYGAPGVVFQAPIQASLIFYNWTSQSQLMVHQQADGKSGFSILNTQYIVWRIEPATNSCCIDPTQTGVSPPRPDWMQENSTYDGQVIINEVVCDGWTKEVPDVAQFSWYTSVKTGRPFRLNWANQVLMDFSYYSTAAENFPDGVFDVPSYCPWEVTDPNCSIFR